MRNYRSGKGLFGLVEVPFCRFVAIRVRYVSFFLVLVGPLLRRVLSEQTIPRRSPIWKISSFDPFSRRGCVSAPESRKTK